MWRKLGLSVGFLIVSLPAAFLIAIPLLPAECQYPGVEDTTALERALCTTRVSQMGSSFWFSAIAAFLPTFWISQLRLVTRLKIGALCFLTSLLIKFIAGNIAVWGILSGNLPFPVVLCLRLLGFVEIWMLSSWLSKRASRVPNAKR